MGLVAPAFEAPIEAPKVVSLGDSGSGAKRGGSWLVNVENSLPKVIG